METEYIFVDEGLDENSAKPNAQNLASTGSRFANYLIDLVVTTIFQYSLMALFFAIPESEVGESLGMVVYFLMRPIYYVICEAGFGKTLGKLATSTRVVNIHGEKPTFQQIFVRSLCRLIPFEPFSAFNSNKIMWHDSLSKTYLINEK